MIVNRIPIMTLFRFSHDCKSIAYVRDPSPIGVVTPCRFTPNFRSRRSSCLTEANVGTGD